MNNGIALVALRPDALAMLLAISFVARAFGFRDIARTLWIFTACAFFLPWIAASLLNSMPKWGAALTLAVVTLMLLRMVFGLVIGQHATDALTANLIASGVRGIFSTLFTTPANIIRRYFPMR